MDKNRIAVVGAGLSGLVSIKCLIEDGLVPTAFEQSAEIGGLWNYHESLLDGGGPAYRSLRTNTSKQMMAFSDFPFPEALPDFPHRVDVLQYLNEYADHFKLREWIKLRTAVESVVPIEGGQWEVTSRAGDTTATEVFDGVLVCSGVYRQPIIPDYPGSQQFRGRLLHSVSYKGPESYKDGGVIIVGVGSSGADIAVEVSRVAHQVILSTTKGAWFIPKLINGKPYDHNLTRLGGLIPSRIRLRIFRNLILNDYKRQGLSTDLSSLGMPIPAFDLWTARLTASSDLLPAVAAGKIQVKPGVAALDENQATFEDGTCAQADAIISCTGYAMSFPFFPEGLIATTDNCVDLYKHVIHPELPKLGFIGMITVAGPLPPVVELQARVAARVFAGAVRLPSSMQMHQAIRVRRATLARLGAYPMRVQLLDYMDELAKMIGVVPNLGRHWRLLPLLLAGPLTAAQYRLDGSGHSSSAERLIKRSATRSVPRNT